MKIMKIIIINVFFALIIIGCVTEYRISITISPVEGGHIIGDGAYQEEEKVKLKATPEDGFIFSGWEEDGTIVNTDRQYVFEARGNRELKAVFKEKKEQEVSADEVEEASVIEKEIIFFAIESGLEFLIAFPEKGNPWETYAILDFLYRKFELDERYAFENTFDHEKYGKHVLSPMERLADPDFIASLELIEEKTEKPGITWLMARAMYSDYHRIDSDFVEILLNSLKEYNTEFEDRRNPQNSLYGYGVTHVIICFRWLYELGYDLEEYGLEDPWEKFADHLVSIVESNKAKTDLAFEAMAFLSYIGQGHRIRNSWIETVLSHQMPEGSWSRVPGGEADSHPTFLAVWALLEYAHPHAKAPMLVPYNN